ncbi:MAG: Periplasmic binding protein, partial [Actinomycetota bacterium]|nr:Periplasmic binding protein [Actinomycetota bacterium]
MPGGTRKILAVLCLAISFVACEKASPTDIFPQRTPAPDPTSNTGPVIGLVGTMTGVGSWRGDDAFEGADLAVHVLNSGLGRDDPTYQLVTLDDGGDPRKAEDLVAELAASDRTAGIVYAGPPEVLASAEKTLAAGKVPAVLCYGDLALGPQLAPHVFQVS